MDGYGQLIALAILQSQLFTRSGSHRIRNGHTHTKLVYKTGQGTRVVVVAHHAEFINQCTTGWIVTIRLMSFNTFDKLRENLLSCFQAHVPNTSGCSQPANFDLREKAARPSRPPGPQTSRFLRKKCHEIILAVCLLVARVGLLAGEPAPVLILQINQSNQGRQ